jgi:hypothetical protein
MTTVDKGSGTLLKPISFSALGVRSESAAVHSQQAGIEHTPAHAARAYHHPADLRALEKLSACQPERLVGDSDSEGPGERSAGLLGACLLLFITAVPSTKLCAGGGGG